jgi:peptidoglycan/LPS O-acetylase OafA/YrhL
MRGHANNFDGLRIIAALLVLFSHMFALSGRWEPRFFQGHSFGNLGVLIFFSISGYLVSASWARDPDLGRFLAKRFLRIAPGLAVAVPLTYGVVRACGLLGFPDNPWHLLNGSLWTIEFEVYCYFILAGLAMLTKTPALVFTAGALASYLLLPEHHLITFGLFFAAGTLLHAYPALRTGKALAGLLVVALVSHHEPRIALALSVPALTIWIGNRSWPVLRSAGRFGDLSYGVYIYAWPVQQLVVAAFGREASYIALLIPSLAITLPWAWLSWRYVEAPALNRKPSTRRSEGLLEVGQINIDSAGRGPG